LLPGLRFSSETSEALNLDQTPGARRRTTTFLVFDSLCLDSGLPGTQGPGRQREAPSCVLIDVERLSMALVGRNHDQTPGARRRTTTFLVFDSLCLDSSRARTAHKGTTKVN